MSLSTMVETFDMPMTDYNEDGDIPMAGSSENWFQPLSRMDEDAHHIGPFSDSQEVDMMAFEETTTEYEMADEAAEPQVTDVDTNVLDAEVYDATIQPSPLPMEHHEIIEHHVERSELVDANGAVEDSHPTITHDSSGDAQHFPPVDTTQAHGTLQLTSGTHDSALASVSHVPEDGYEHHPEPEPTERPTTAAVHSSREVAVAENDHSLPPSDHVATLTHSHESEIQTKGDPGPTDKDRQATTTEHTIKKEASQEHKLAEESFGSVEHAVVEHSESHSAPQVYLQPPPPVHLSLQVTSTEGDQPEFVLFNLPESGSHTTEEPLVLLQHHPELFYEPVSAVFDAFRQEEYFSHLDELSEAEMAMNAHELQLVISEDNIYSREVSLQDLYAMHQGVGLPGHLRLTLQSIVPRFITRYNHLRDQITRLVLTGESEETRHHAEYVIDEGEEHDAQASVPANEPREEFDRGDESAEPESAREKEDAESAGYPPEADDQLLVEEGAAENGDNKEEEHEAGDTAPGTVAEDQNEGSEHDDDASGESDDAEYELDTDVEHDAAPEDTVESLIRKDDTEYAREVEPHEGGEEGDGNDFREDGEADSGAAEDVVEPTVLPEVDETELHADEDERDSAPEAKEVEPGEISHSTPASSFDADESSWEDAVEENGLEQGIEQETDQSMQRTTTTVFDEEGKLADELEDGDEFDDEDFGYFDESAEGTLEDLTEETEEVAHSNETSEVAEDAEKDADATSRAILAESEKFVSSLENDGKGLDTAKEAAPDDSSRTHDHSSSTTTDASSETGVVDKNVSKRSLDDAGLVEEEAVSPGGSPDSKRTRTL